MTEVVGSVTGLAYTVYTIIYIFGGVVPYIPQYLEIRRIRNIRGFSTFVCLTLLLANLLRICFWFVHPFSKPLLIQSLVMVAAMLMMMQLAAQVLYSEHQSHSPVIGQRATSVVALRTIWSAPVEHFWHWTDFSSYLMFTLIFTLVASMITYLFSDSQLFIAFLGFAALFTEALLGLPQLLKNYRNQSTRGMRYVVYIRSKPDKSNNILFVHH
ncbi:hypothetical protein AHF37_10331 [Paragonimus kellicotti]|nr:hypothetical protein AHF37_10331 [Paragonimus kellicotti]